MGLAPLDEEITIQALTRWKLAAWMLAMSQMLQVKKKR